jgi:hypothetical protein
MSTLTGHSGAATPHGKANVHRRVRHPLVTAIGVIVVAIIIGAMVGLIYSSVVGGAGTTATRHTGGAHARAAELVKVHHMIAAERTKLSQTAAVTQSSGSEP